MPPSLQHSSLAQLSPISAQLGGGGPLLLDPPFGEGASTHSPSEQTRSPLQSLSLEHSPVLPSALSSLPPPAQAATITPNATSAPASVSFIM